MHIVTILRYYLGLSQAELSKLSGVSYADINEIENKPDYGCMGKYCKLAEYLCVPVHTIVMNSILGVPEAFFAKMTPAGYLCTTKSKAGVLGRQGEDRVLQEERERLMPVNQNLAKLVIPCYKQRASRGYDILSYKEDGTPFFIEVKTSEKEIGCVQLTKHEYETANKWTDRGYEYWIYYFSNWGTPGQELKKILYRNLREENRVEPSRYSCDFRERKETENGILHFRRQRGYSQLEAANLLEIPASSLCKYETGENQCPVTVYKKMARLYLATIDELLKKYTIQSNEN